jgi:quinol monooxygenase YgiN
MMLRRRAFVFLAGAAVAGPFVARTAGQTAKKEPSMYGVIGKMTAVPGQRDALVAILLEGTGAMPGCLSYIIAADATDADALWITEVWESQASHQASLQLAAVKAAIARGRPLIAGFSDRVETSPIGGTGLAGRR